MGWGEGGWGHVSTMGWVVHSNVTRRAAAAIDGHGMYAVAVMWRQGGMGPMG